MGLRLKVLLIEDDEDDYILIRELLADVTSTKYHLDWTATYDAALEAARNNIYDVYLLDYRLGERNGLELLNELSEGGHDVPTIFLTGKGDYKVDIEAMRAGAADYLVKGEINSHLLERSIRYSIERKRSRQALKESERQLKFLSSQLLRVQESERQRIAAELHDDLGQVLTAIKYGVEHAVDLMKHGMASPESLEVLIPTIQHAIEEVRRIYTHLRPSLIDDLGIVATIGWYCREFQRVYPNIRIKKHIRIQEEDVPESLRVVIFRVIQEAMNNITKHSQAKLVDLSLSKNINLVELAIRDYGRGFDSKEALSGKNYMRGLGLVSMKERVELSGGSLKIKTLEGGGTTIHASWPLSPLP